jgi:hypothetical protein
MRQTMETFESPNIANSIETLKDFVKEAQAGAAIGALTFSSVGVLLLTIAFSLTDQDLLLEHSSAIAPLGIQLSPELIFAFGPLLFMFLHAISLVRWDRVNVTLGYFSADIAATVPLASHRERIRQLLPTQVWNQALRGLPLLVGFSFPVMILLIVRVISIKYQNESVNWVQRVALCADLVVLVWFFRRRRLVSRTYPRRIGLSGWIALLWVPVGLVAADLAWLNVPQTGETTLLQLRGRTPATLWQKMANPIDLALCPSVARGCRFLTVDQRMLVDHVWKGEALVDLRAGTGDVTAALAAIDGIFLRDRTLRFGQFNGSQLYRANFRGADLRHATLTNADLRGADLMNANLAGADLTNADLRGSNVSQEQLDLTCGKAAKLPSGLVLKPCSP